jgi:iron complex transport system substrate-binding protein
MKILSLLPSATEICYALGLDEELAGVTFECDHPPEARGKRIVSRASWPVDDITDPSDIDVAVGEKVAAGEPLYRIDEDLVRSIGPDLILAQDLCRVCAVPSGEVTEALDKLGCAAEVVSLDPHNLDEVVAGIERVGEAAHRKERGEALAAGLRRRIAAVVERAAALAPVGALALEWADPPFVGGHWIPEMIAKAGGADVLGVPGQPSRRASWDEIAAAAPEVVVFMPCGYGLDEAAAQAGELFARRPFASTPAARSGRVVAVDASAYFSRPGPRIVKGLEILAWALHPGAFPAPPPDAARVVPGGGPG